MLLRTVFFLRFNSLKIEAKKIKLNNRTIEIFDKHFFKLQLFHLQERESLKFFKKINKKSP
ncbi:hypothetical protein BpHYR1_051057 [Brachionus plicatilis]|uniref:Uncharacterized protein n=1 Tax=Brachionus plicatilis TaxID=10195 RepID=A0A3M7PQX0_BRAPC|nr:hypothetical protein BpHYR1_051057 [Brachionus plicatilis]